MEKREPEIVDLEGEDEEWEDDEEWGDFYDDEED